MSPPDENRGQHDISPAAASGASAVSHSQFLLTYSRVTSDCSMYFDIS